MSIRVVRSSAASWQGTVPDGGGRIALGSGAFEGPFTLKARVEDVEKATNPEELIGAAEAGCYTMSLANLLSEAGHPPDDLRTTAKVTLQQLETGFSITRIELRTESARFPASIRRGSPSSRSRRRRRARCRARSPVPRSRSRRRL